MKNIKKISTIVLIAILFLQTMVFAETINPETKDAGSSLAEEVSCETLVECSTGSTPSFTGQYDKNGCKIYKCSETQEIREEIKCIFDGSETEEKCYSEKGSCAGTGSCIVIVKGKKGEKIQWKSSCGGYAYTKMDGNSEYARFDCKPEEVECAIPVCDDDNIYFTGQYDKEGCKIYKCKEPSVECPADCRCDSNGNVIACTGKYVNLNEKFDLYENQEATVIDYRNMKIKLIDIIQACIMTENTLNEQGTASGGAGCSFVGGKIAVEMPSDCIPTSSDEACSGIGTEFIIKSGETKEVFGASISLKKLNRNYATFLVTTTTQEDYVDIAIEPKTQTINYGESAEYIVTVVDKHPGIRCVTTPCPQPVYTYQIDVLNLPFLKTYPKQVSVEAGSKESFTLTVNPYRLVANNQGTESTIAVQSAQAVIKNLANENKISGSAITQIAAAEEEPEEVSAQIKTSERIEQKIEIQPYYIKEYRFSVRAKLSGDPKVSDTAYATLKIRPKEDITPPPFPSEETEIQLYKGWNLISLPGKLVTFEQNGLTRKLLGFVYLKDEQTYVTLQEAQEKLGDNFREYLATNAFWVYSYTDYILKAKIDKEVSFNSISLNKNWNLVPITEDMIGGYLDDLKGNCEFQKIYKWKADSQSWQKITDDYLFQSNELNKGIIVKAADYCIMGGVTISKLTPPAMPE